MAKTTKNRPMIDIHSHILPGIDDGAKTPSESLEILEGLASQGITDVILTPHYIVDTAYTSPRKANEKLLTSLRSKIISKKASSLSRSAPLPSFPNLHLGNEIYIDRNIYDLLNDSRITPLSGSKIAGEKLVKTKSKYLLVELPMSGKFPESEEIFRSLLKKGYRIILAHPERYHAFQKDFKKLEELKDSGVLFQSNLGSILGQYGKSAKKTIKKLAKKDMIFCFGTDIHHSRDYSEIEKAQKKLRRYYSEAELDKVLSMNAAKILHGK